MRLSHIIITTTPSCRYFSHLTNKETEAGESPKVTQEIAEPGLEASITSLTPKPCS